MSLFGGREFQMGKWMKLPSVNHDRRVQREQLSREGRKRSEDEGQPANLQGCKDKGCCDLQFMVLGCDYFLLLRLGWPTLVVVCLLLIIGVPCRPGQEFKWECYFNQFSMDTSHSVWFNVDLMLFSKTELKFVGRQALVSIKHGFFQVWGKC